MRLGGGGALCIACALAAVLPTPVDCVQAALLSRAMRRQLAIDPSFEVHGLQISPYNVTKEPASPLIVPSEPWEVTLGYTSVVYAAEQKPPKFIAYW